MTVILFIAVLVVLIVVHELGHFFVAKFAKMRVEEFGIGYPPRALTVFRKNGTDYTLNWLPFGGFVKIYGEDDSASGAPAPDSFAAKPRIVQAIVLLAGIAMNILFAWVLFSSALALGMPRALEGDAARTAPDAVLTISRIVPNTPASEAGLLPQDVIVNVQSETAKFTSTSAEDFTEFVAQSVAGEPLLLLIKRDGAEQTLAVTPRTGIVPSDASRVALGVGVATVGTKAVSLWEAPIEGAVLTFEATKQIAIGLIGFFGSIFTLSADLSQVAGPVGIAGAVGDASASGIVPLMLLMAVISLNLALVNVLPVPALDGGRLLFVIIEAIIRKPIPQGFASAVNTLGFGFLILLMLAITASDIFKLIG